MKMVAKNVEISLLCQEKLILIAETKNCIVLKSKIIFLPLL